MTNKYYIKYKERVLKEARERYKNLSDEKKTKGEMSIEEIII